MTRTNGKADTSRQTKPTSRSRCRRARGAASLVWAHMRVRYGAEHRYTKAARALYDRIVLDEWEDAQDDA